MGKVLNLNFFGKLHDHVITVIKIAGNVEFAAHAKTVAAGPRIHDGGLAGNICACFGFCPTWQLSIDRYRPTFTPDIAPIRILAFHRPVTSFISATTLTFRLAWTH